MNSNNGTVTAGVLLSGGLDSCILVAHLLQQGAHVQPFYIQSHLYWQQAEVRATRRFLDAIRSRRLLDLVELEVPLADLYQDHWSITGRDVPDGDTQDEAVFLPGRNTLLLVKATLWCQLHGISSLALAPLGNNPFPDASSEFFDGFQRVVELSGDEAVRIVRPFEKLSKQAVMDLGRHLPLELTFSCLAPEDEMHCGRCNKCAERRAAFRATGLEDGTFYADSACPAPIDG